MGRPNSQVEHIPSIHVYGPYTACKLDLLKTCTSVICRSCVHFISSFIHTSMCWNSIMIYYYCGFVSYVVYYGDIIGAIACYNVYVLGCQRGVHALRTFVSGITKLKSETLFRCFSSEGISSADSYIDYQFMISVCDR